MAESPTLTWTNVLIGLLFIVFDALLSLVLGLGVGGSLMVAALRCILQLSIMGLVLDKVFASQNPWGVAGIALLLNILGAFEATYNKSKRRFTNMFPLILCAILCGTIPISVLGQQFAMTTRPFWQPDQYVPMLGMLLGNAISAIIRPAIAEMRFSLRLGVNAVSREFTENRDKIETYLAMGATRFEACKPIGVEALKMALLPTVNQLSVIGLISIPGMMTGAIVGGKSVEQAARLQMIIMFMISAASALTALMSLVFALSILVDSQHRIRPDRLDSRKPLFYRYRDAAVTGTWKGIKRLQCWGREKGTEEERRGLLDEQR